jgi:hypothetical protein
MKWRGCRPGTQHAYKQWTKKEEVCNNG